MPWRSRHQESRSPVWPPAGLVPQVARRPWRQWHSEIFAVAWSPQSSSGRWFYWNMASRQLETAQLAEADPCQFGIAERSAEPPRHGIRLANQTLLPQGACDELANARLYRPSHQESR